MIQGAAARTLFGAVAGATTGDVLHAALLDGTFNVVAVTGGGVFGLLLGMLWSVEAVVVGSGVISSTLRQVSSTLLGEVRDREAGERMLSSVREGLDQLRRVGGAQGLLLRAALDLLGVTSDPGVAKLAAAAEDAQQTPATATDASLSQVLGQVIEATIEARLFDLRLIIAFVGLVLVGSADALLAFLGGLTSW